MAVERVYGGTTLIDVLDRILDKGLVIDVWARISVVGLEVITIEARVVVASVDTYLRYAQAISLTPLVSRPPVEQSQGSLGNGQRDRNQGRPLQGVTRQLQGVTEQLGGAEQEGSGSTAGVAAQLRSILEQLEGGQRTQPLAT